MTFSTNQVRHLYVVKDVQPSVGTAADAGTLAVKTDAEKANLYFEYKSPGGLVRSDLIDIKNISYAKATDATSLRRELGQVKVTLDPNVHAGGIPVPGQDYLLRVAIRQFAGMSDEDLYFKHGLVRATSNMTAEQFYVKLKESLVMNFSRESSKLLDFTFDGVKATKVLAIPNDGITVTAKNAGPAGNDITIEITSVTAAATAVTVAGSAISVALAGTALDPATIADLKDAIAASAEAAALVTITGADATAVAVEASAQLAGGTATGVVITEVEQEWKRGVLAQVPVYFSVHPTTILVGGVDEIWGVATPLSSGIPVGNGKNIADLEYFCMGERGDHYRNIGWPHVTETTYLVDPKLEYSVLDIHYAYVGSNEGVQKSERDITLVGSKTAINAVIGDIFTEAGITIADLD